MAEHINYESLEQLEAAIRRLTGPQMTKMAERAGFKIGQEFKTVLSRKPGPSNQPVKWASEKQRTWYFAARRKDNLPFKYARNSDPWSQKSSTRWTVQKIPGGAVVGNPATYSPYVYSSQYQTAQHEATGWTTDEKAADQVMNSAAVRRIVVGEVKHILDDTFRGL